jgi:hypothetical protein
MRRREALIYARHCEALVCQRVWTGPFSCHGRACPGHLAWMGNASISGVTGTSPVTTSNLAPAEGPSPQLVDRLTQLAEQAVDILAQCIEARKMPDCFGDALFGLDLVAVDRFDAAGQPFAVHLLELLER